MAEGFPEHPFWNFSLRVYGTAGVPPACLRLQEAHGLDVNVVLFCCWLGASGRGALSPAERRAMVEAVGAWHETVVRAVRAVRQRLKGGMAPAPPELSEPLRRRIAKIEVDLEHVEQLMLAAAVERPAEAARTPEARLDDALENVRGYLAEIGVAPGEGDARDFAEILKAAFGALAPATVNAASRRHLAA